jgi:hypothetical protein
MFCSNYAQSGYHVVKDIWPVAPAFRSDVGKSSACICSLLPQVFEASQTVAACGVFDLGKTLLRKSKAGIGKRKEKIKKS